MQQGVFLSKRNKQKIISFNVLYSTNFRPTLNDRHFAKLGGGLDKGNFYFINMYNF